MAYVPQTPRTEFGFIHSELTARREDSAAQSRALGELEVRLHRLEALLGVSPYYTSALAGNGFAPQPLPLEQQLKAAEQNWESEISDLMDFSGHDEAAGEGESRCAPPKSFFAYCTSMLSSSDKHERYRVGWQLLMYVMLLAMFSGCFLDACKGRAVLMHWGWEADSYDTSCFYQGKRTLGADELDEHVANALHFRKRYEGVSLPFVCVGVSCMLLLSLYMRDANVSLLYQAAFAEEGKKQLPCLWRLLIILGEVVRTIVVPIEVAAGAALQLSQSLDVADVMLNAFAATFLLEMDGTLYSIAISAEAKQAYHRQWHAQSRLARKLRLETKIPNYVFLADAAVLSSLFVGLHLREFGWSRGSEYQKELAIFLRVILYFAALVRIVLMQVAMTRIRSQQDSGVSWSNFWRGGLKGIRLTLVAVASRLVFRLFFAQDPTFDYASIASCFNGTDILACTCGQRSV